MAEWWHKCEAIPLARPNFQKIIEFYLFKCPCETESGSRKKITKFIPLFQTSPLLFAIKDGLKGNSTLCVLP